MKKITLLFFLTLILDFTAQAQYITAKDVAGNYGTTWNSGSNQGFGYGSWSFTITGSGAHYLGGTGLGSNTFGIYAGGGSGNSFSAFRSLNSQIGIGTSISFELGYTGVNPGGTIGVNFYSGGNWRFTIKFTGGGSFWTLNDGGGDFNTTIPWDGDNPPLTFKLTRNSGNGYSVLITQNGTTYTGNNYTAASGSMAIDKIEFFSSAQGSGNNLGFDTLSVEASDPGQVSSTADVEINGNVILANSQTLTVNNLTIPSGNTFTIASDATGNGSLIVNGTVTGSATVQRYIAAYSSASGTGNGWHLLSSPVNNMAIAGSDFVPGTGDDLYTWGEATNKWLNYKVSANNIANFTNGEGYLVAFQTTATKNFTGIVNTGDISFQNLSLTSSGGNGWHLLGNPYPSALTWGDGNWSLTGVNGVAKVWNESAGNYSDVSSGGIIPSTNGFFVQVNSATNTLTIPAADRIHNATDNFKSTSAANKKETLTFKVTNDANGYYDVATLGFKNDATEGFDHAFDSHKLFSMVKTAPSLWTVSKAQQLSTNFLPEITTAYEVPLDFKPGVSTVYHLSVTGVKSFENPNFVLEDTKTGEMIDLTKQTTYDFSADKGDNVNRFILHIDGVTAVPNLNQKDAVQVFSYGKTIYLSGNESLNGEVSVFNTLGQQVYEGTLNGMNKQTIRLNQQRGIYFVRVKENSYVVTKKVFIQ